MSPFFCYQSHRRSTLKVEKPTLNNTEVIQTMTKEWYALNEEQRVPFVKQTAQQKERYETEMKAYKIKLASMPPAPPVAAPAKKGKAKKEAPAKVEKVSGKKRPASKAAEKETSKAKKVTKKAPAKPAPKKAVTPVKKAAPRKPPTKRTPAKAKVVSPAPVVEEEAAPIAENGHAEEVEEVEAPVEVESVNNGVVEAVASHHTSP